MLETLIQTQRPPDLPAGSPLWWAYELSAELAARERLIQLYEDYFEGRHRLAFASSPFRAAFGAMIASVSDNWIPLVIGAAVERLKPQGFLFGDDQDGDDEAWRIWQENYLDADAPLTFTEACKHGEAYLLVWAPEQPQGVFGRFFSRRSERAAPRITVEHPSQVVVRRESGDRRRRAAALKQWRESDGTILATLYLPDEVYRFQRDAGKWVARKGVDYVSRHGLGVVPVVPIVNEPQMLPSMPPHALTTAPHDVDSYSSVGLGRSDQADIVSTVDQINKLLADMLVASEVAAYKQRWATGLEVPRDEEGDPVEGFKPAIDRLWVSEDSEAKFGEFAATDLANYYGAVEQRIQSLAARTRTPPHYLLGSVVNVSGDALKAAEAGLSSKVEGKKATFGEGIEEAIRLAFAWLDDERAGDTSASIAWAPSEARSESEYVDSLVKKLSIGIPKEQLWRDAGYSPQEISRFKVALLEEGVRQDIFRGLGLGDDGDAPV